MAKSDLVSSPVQIDHIVLLLSPQDFENVPVWLTDNFTIIEGGKHSKGTSHNKLIIFRDGSYLELFSWVDPPPTNVDAHADFPGWAKKPVDSIIDWAVTGSDAHGKFDEVTTQLKDLLSSGTNLNVGYDQPVAGGRKRKDGRELRWVTTRPRRLNTANESGDTDPAVPFFCHDISPRIYRVPYVQGSIDSWPDLVTHPCGAIGIAALTVAIPAAQTDGFVRLYESILGTRALIESKVAQKTYRFALTSPSQVEQESESIVNEAYSWCKIELVATDQQTQSGTSLQKLVVRTNDERRKGQRLDGGRLNTPILLE